MERRRTHLPLVYDFAVQAPLPEARALEVPTKTRTCRTIRSEVHILVVHREDIWHVIDLNDSIPIP